MLTRELPLAIASSGKKPWECDLPAAMLPLGHRSGPSPSLNVMQKPLKEGGGDGSEETGGTFC